jgi:tape measure domain-containing protein
MRQGLEYIINLSDGSFGRGMSNAQRQTSALDSAVRNLGSSLAAAFAASRLFDIGEDAVQTSAKVNNLERAIKFAGGKEGAENLAFVRKEANDLGLDLMSAETGFKTLSGAMMGNTQLAKHQRQIFTGLAMGMTALGGSSENFEGALLAVSQMASKGTVSAEELRGQLGERLPGAFGIAARAMNMTEAELGKAMQKGEIFASDFLPKFAAELQKTFGAEATKNADSFVANMNRQNSALMDTKTVLGEQLQPAYLSYLELQVKAMGLLSATVGFVKDNEACFKALALGVGAVAVAYGLYVGAQKIALAVQAIQYTSGLLYLGYLEAQALGLGVAASAQHALNVAMNLNPIGLIITGIGILAAGLYYAYQKSETFRASLKGAWAVMTELMGPVAALGKAMVGIFTFNPSMVAEGLAQVKSSIETMDLKGAFAKAYNSEVSNSNKASENNKNGLGNAPAVGGANPNATGTGVKGSAAAGNSVRNVSVTIQNVVKELIVNSSSVKESTNEIRKQVAQIMVDTIRDYEQALG